MKLELFDKEGNLFNFELDKPFINKPQSRIYRLDNDKCLKYFIWKYSEINDQTFRMIADMKLPGFYKIYDLLYDNKGDFKSYTMDFYLPSKNINLLTMSNDYTIENFRILNDSVNRLSEEGIRVIDLHDDNVIITDNGIVVIDIDLYVKSLFLDDDKVFKYNRVAVYSLFKKLYKRYLIDRYYYREYEIDCKIIDELFIPNNSVDTVCKKLSRYKRPIDYITSERK